MGIPSYYKKLVKTSRGLVTSYKHDVDWLFMDFNCLIYHCISPYPGDDQKEEWEATLIASICAYCLQVRKEVAPKQGVFIAIDGVVPMAKMRQQRLRRFKSIWLATQESVQKWDTNAITPGTEFMRKLRIALEQMIRDSSLRWSFSSSDEPGEGEHKILAEWRKGTYKGNFAVYGLDADLIILSMLGQECCSLKNEIWLFREVQNAPVSREAQNAPMFREVQNAKDAKDISSLFEWFSINVLRDWICTDRSILNYCCAMSILGNDFLPSSLGLKIRDNGHEYLCTILSQMAADGISLVDDTSELSMEGLKWLFTALSVKESEQIETYLGKKRALGYGVNVPCGHNDWPLMQQEEQVLLNGRGLDPAWKSSYLSLLKHDSIETVCEEYLRGIQWNWAYYTGKPVCFNWYYSFSLPPLWEWLRDCHSLSNSPSNTILYLASDIRPVEQLALVLPLESWSLIPPCPEKKFPLLAPQFYPSEFTFDSVGKRFFWECEAMIPMPSIKEMKEIIAL
jgi:5'-3' exonuclease